MTDLPFSDHSFAKLQQFHGLALVLACANKCNLIALARNHKRGNIMGIHFGKTAMGVAFAASCLVAGLANAQPPAAPAAAAAPAPAPEYARIALESAVVNKPAAEVWARVGGWCAIQEWFPAVAPCVAEGNGEVGSVRRLTRTGNIVEIMVAKTAMSYTYSQPVRPGTPYNQYHGTLEVRAVTPTTSKIYYTIMIDHSLLADQAAKDRDRASRSTTFNNGLANMKILAEGGTLPPPAAPAGRGGGAPAAAAPAPARAN